MTIGSTCGYVTVNHLENHKQQWSIKIHETTLTNDGGSQRFGDWINVLKDLETFLGHKQAEIPPQTSQAIEDNFI